MARNRKIILTRVLLLFTLACQQVSSINQQLSNAQYTTIANLNEATLRLAHHIRAQSQNSYNPRFEIIYTILSAPLLPLLLPLRAKRQPKIQAPNKLELVGDR